MQVIIPQLDMKLFRQEQHGDQTLFLTMSHQKICLSEEQKLQADSEDMIQIMEKELAIHLWEKTIDQERKKMFLLQKTTEQIVSGLKLILYFNYY